MAGPVSSLHVPAPAAAAVPNVDGHLHLWALADGTGLHAPLGHLVRDTDSGRVCCHLCGRWFIALGAHVRVHGYTPDLYRTAMGLRSSQGLVAASLSEQIRRRQVARYESDAEVRQALGIGQALARSGQLAWRHRAATASLPEPAQRVRERREQLAAGRASQDATRGLRLAGRLAALGAQDLPSYLRSAYAQGASLDSLATATGLGRAQLRQALAAAGVPVRSTGINTKEGKRSRARTAEARAADQLGVPDLHAWLRDRYAEGWTLVQLGRAVGHSSHWVSWRLDATRDDSRPGAGAAAARSPGA